MRADMIQIILFALLDGFLIFSLYSILGQQNKLNQDSRKFYTSFLSYDTSELNIKDRSENFDLLLQSKIFRIRKSDPEFSIHAFLKEAERAFRTIVLAYASEETKILEDFLSYRLNGEFKRSILERKAEGEELKTKIISVDLPLILDIEFKGNIVRILVKFISEQQHIRHKKNGEVVEGSLNQIERIMDLWTFERELSSLNSNWILIKIES